MLSERLCDFVRARSVCVTQRRPSVAILTNGDYGDVFAMLAAGQLRVQMAAELRLTLKYKLVPARDDPHRVMVRVRPTFLPYPRVFVLIVRPLPG